MQPTYVISPTAAAFINYTIRLVEEMIEQKPIWYFMGEAIIVELAKPPVPDVLVNVLASIGFKIKLMLSPSHAAIYAELEEEIVPSFEVKDEE